MPLNEMKRTFEVGQVVFAKVIGLIQAKKWILFNVGTKVFGEVLVNDHEEHDHSGGREDHHKKNSSGFMF